MDLDIYTVSCDFWERRNACVQLGLAGDDLEYATLEEHNMGQLSGLSSLSMIRDAYLCFYQLYTMFGKLAYEDFEKMMTIAMAFEGLDSSAND